MSTHCSTTELHAHGKCANNREALLRKRDIRLFLSNFATVRIGEKPRFQAAGSKSDHAKIIPDGDEVSPFKTAFGESQRSAY